MVTAPTNGAAGIIPAVMHYYARFVPGADDDGIVHVAVQVFKNENRLDAYALKITQHLRGLPAVVDGLSILVGGAVSAGRQGVLDVRYGEIYSTAHQAAGDAPFERRQVQCRARHTHQPDGAHLFDRLHHYDGSGGIDQHF